MAAVPSPSLEVFTPVQALAYPETSQDWRVLAGRVRDVTNGLFAYIEAEALYPAEETVASATAALLGALPLGDAEYDIGGGFLIRATDSFKVPFASAEEWAPPRFDEEPIEPVIEVETSVSARTEQPGNMELLESVLAMRQLGQGRGTPTTNGHKSLMGVSGTPTGGRFKRRYTYNAEQQAAVRERIGQVVIQDETAQVDAHTVVRTPLALGALLESGPFPLDLRSARSLGRRGEIVEPTAPHLVVPALRVVRALMSRSA